MAIALRLLNLRRAIASTPYTPHLAVHQDWGEAIDVSIFFSQQPVVMEYMTEQLVRQFCDDISAHKLTFFNRYALIKAQAKDYIREVQIHLILQPVKDKLLAAFGHQQNLENHLNRLLANQPNADLSELISPQTTPSIFSGSFDETIKRWSIERSCLSTLRVPRPYEGMKISYVVGLNEAQSMTLKALGAVNN